MEVDGDGRWGGARTARAVRQSVRELQLDQLDLMLIHGAWTLSEKEAVEVWRGLIDAKAAGLTKQVLHNPRDI